MDSVILKYSSIHPRWNVPNQSWYYFIWQCNDTFAEIFDLVGCLCWGLTSQSTIFQSYRDGAIASWVINQYFRGVKCLAQGHNTAAVGLEPRTSRSGVRHSTTEPPRSPEIFDEVMFIQKHFPKFPEMQSWFRTTEPSALSAILVRSCWRSS